MNATSKAKRIVLGIEIPRDELAARMAEQCIGLKRPIGMTARESLDQLRSHSPETVDAWERSADAAVLFFHECINAGRQPS